MYPARRFQCGPDRVTGMVAGLHGQVSSVNVLHADFLMDEAFKVTDHYLKYHPAPDYFVGCNNQISLGIIKACIRHNLIPQKMSRCSASMKSLMPIFTDSISRVFPMIFRKLPGRPSIWQCGGRRIAAPRRARWLCAVSSNPESASSFRLWLCWLRSSTPVTYWCMLPNSSFAALPQSG